MNYKIVWLNLEFNSTSKSEQLLNKPSLAQVGVLEDAIMEKKRQVERLVQEMKEANLQSLTGSVDELRHPLDGKGFFTCFKVI